MQRSNPEAPGDANSMIGRWVAFLATPLITLVAGFIALKANSWFDMNLSPGDVAAYVGGVVFSIGTAIGVWLHNRGKHEIARTLGMSDEHVGAIMALIESRLPPAPSSSDPSSSDPPMGF